MYVNIDTPQTLLRRQVQFVVPDFQRPYVWGIKQVGDFWSGLTGTACKDDGSFGTYFLGTIVLTERASVAGSPARWIVLDGGQRLISMFVLLCAIRDHAVAAGGVTRYNQITDEFLINPHQGDGFRYKLIVTPKDRDAFRACINSDVDLGINGPIMEAYRFFRMMLHDVDSVDRILEAFLDHTELVKLVADESIFESLYSVEPAHVRSLIQRDESAQDVIAIAGRHAAVRRFHKLLEDNEYFDREVGRTPDKKAETVWQKFFEANPWILGVSLAGQLLTSWSEDKLEQAVTGFSIATVGKRTDALLRTSGRIRSMVFVECKTHRTSLLGREYRPGCWSPSDELAGGVAQLQGTIYRAVNQIGERLFDRGKDGTEIPGESTYLIRPRSFLVIGQLTDLIGSQGGVHPDKLRSFELYRRSTVEPDILTFDELLARAEWYVPPSTE